MITRVVTKVSDEEWEREGGVPCNGCSIPVLRLFGGICKKCLLLGDVVREKATQRRSARRRLRQGDLSLSDLRQGKI